MKFLITLLIAVCIFLSQATPALAHTLKRAGTIGVTIHIDPDDEPISGNAGNIYVSFQDKTGRLKADNPRCLCSLTIWQGDQKLEELPVVSGGSYLPLSYVFPAPGVYQIKVTGIPEDERFNFDAFEVEYEYYVKASGKGFSSLGQSGNKLKSYFMPVFILATVLSTLLLINLLDRKEVKTNA